VGRRTDRPPNSGRTNAWIASQLREVAARFDLEDGVHHPRAYRRAAETVEDLRQPIAALRREGGQRALEALPGIGPRIGAVVGELLDSGHAEILDELREKSPMDVMALLAVDGIGRKTLKLLHDELDVRTLEDLAQALEDGRVQKLPSFGPRREERLRRAVRLQQRGRDRVPRTVAEPVARRLRELLAEHPGVRELEIAGSLRRRASTVGDIDLVAACEDAAGLAERLLRHRDVDYVYSRGPRRVSVRLAQGIDVDLRTVDPASFGSALLYFTGNRAHTLALRRLALAQGMRLNEYGLFSGGRRLAGETEADVYAALSLPFIPPEKRRGESEIRDALRVAERRGT